jgi:uncharacterized protein YecT (DUF1311 family)
MKYFLSFIFTILSVYCYGQTRNFSGNSQSEMNSNAVTKYKEVNEKMKVKYKQILNKNKRDKLFLFNFAKSQKNWELWRESEIEAFYPNYLDSKDFYGSMQPICKFSKLIEWTEERIKHFDIYIHGVEEGDLCAPARN